MIKLFVINGLAIVGILTIAFLLLYAVGAIQLIADCKSISNILECKHYLVIIN